MTILDRIPPHSLELETSILGCLLMNNGLIEKAQQTFGDKPVFYATKNQTIYEAITALYGNNLPIDLVGIRYRLKESGHLDTVGDAYLSSLEDAVPHALSFNYYAQEMLKYYSNRKKIEAATRVIEGLYAGKDVDASELVPLLENSGSGASSGIVRPLDLESAVQTIYQGGGLTRGADIGCTPMDEYYTIAPGQLSIVTGIPSHGKSSWLTWVMVCLAMRHGWRFCVFSPENYPLEKYLLRIIATYAGVSQNNLTSGIITCGIEWAQEHFAFLQPANPTVANLIGLVRQCHEKTPLSGFIIDPWNEIDAPRPDGLTETEFISSALSSLKRLAQSLSQHVWVVAHPMKLMRDKEGRYPIPTPYDISGSGHWRNKADNCLCIWRDVLDDENITDIHIQKIRFAECGKVGKVSLHFNYQTGGRYEPMGGHA